jgi:hypothetical protein
MTLAAGAPAIVRSVTGGPQPGANRAFADDALIVLMLLNRARRRVVTDVFGVSELSGEESLLITLIALAALGRAFGEATPTVPRPSRPSPVNIVMGAALIKDVGNRIAGSSSRVPGFVGLVAFALIWRYHPLARGSARLARGSAHLVEASERRIRAIYGARPSG